MEPFIGAGSSSQWSNVTSSDHSRVHMGHNYNTTINYGSPYFGLAEDEAKIQAISDQLYFSEIQDRTHRIYDAEEDSYRWAFDAWSAPLQAWLTGGESIFYMSGKPGSGKSTFMKFLRYHPKTQELLKKWTKSESLVMADHYLWCAGASSNLERSREGLYRSLLYQILELLPEATPTLLPHRWKSLKWALPQVGCQAVTGDTLLPARPKWSIKELLDGLDHLSRISETCFVLFIDGLDECHPTSEHGKLLNDLEKLSKHRNLKICVSSRPWKPFEPRFKKLSSHLVMQDLTRPEMERHILTELREAIDYAGGIVESRGSLDISHAAFEELAAYNLKYMGSLDLTEHALRKEDSKISPPSTSSHGWDHRVSKTASHSLEALVE